MQWCILFVVGLHKVLFVLYAYVHSNALFSIIMYKQTTLASSSTSYSTKMYETTQKQRQKPSVPKNHLRLDNYPSFVTGENENTTTADRSRRRRKKRSGRQKLLLCQAVNRPSSPSPILNQARVPQTRALHPNPANTHCLFSPKQNDRRNQRNQNRRKQEHQPV